MGKKKETKFSKIRVLLIEGRARQIMPLMESMHKLGCHVTTFNTSRLDMGFVSHYPNKKILSKCDISSPDSYWEAVSKELKSGNYDLAIPMFDFSAEVLSKHKEEVKDIVDLAVNDWEIFQYARDKLKTMKVCMENNIPCPKTIDLGDSPKELDLESLVFPVCIKPRSGSSAIGFRVIEKKEELLEVIEASTKKYGPILLQEYIPQTDLQYKAELFIDKKGEVKSACVFSKLRWYPINGGSSTLNVTVDRPDIVESCTKLLKIINWHGYADVDLIQDPRDGIAKVMEINPRITGSVKICYASGVNFSQQLLEDHMNEEVTPFMNYKIGQYLRYLHTDILWFFKSKNRWKCKPSWFNFRHSVDQIWSIKDPLPWFAYTFASLFKINKDKKKRKLK